MKIRIKDHSIRLRITQSELKLLGVEGVVSAQTQIVDKIFSYALVVSEVPELTAEYKAAGILILFPKDRLEEWLTTDKVGYQYTQEQNGSHLSILVEKDFVCLDETTEDQSDQFPNPKLS